MAIAEGQLGGLVSAWSGKSKIDLSYVVTTMDTNPADYGYQGDPTFNQENGWSGGWIEMFNNPILLTTSTPVFDIHSGSIPQSTWSYLDSLHPDQSLAMPGVGYLSAANYQLGNSDSLPDLSFEISFAINDPNFGYNGANPRDILVDLLTNPHYGAGFNPAKIADLTAFANYCGSQGIFLSPCYTDQAVAAQMITDLLQLCNSGAYYSEGTLKIVPYGDVNSAGWYYTYTAPTSTLINLGDDDFQVESASDDPVKVLRNAIPLTGSTTSDAYNQVKIEYLNRFNDYNAEICTIQDQEAVDTFGLIPMDVITAHHITDPTVANTVAALLLQRSVYIRNQYEFRLGWNYADLEPTDIVTITDSAMGLNLKPVRILIVEEDDQGTLTITAEDAPPGVASRVQADPATGSGYSVDYNSEAQNVFQPVFIEPPIPVMSGTTGVEVWVGVTGQGSDPLWGGCSIWASMDGASYTKIGTATAPAKIGHLTAALASTLSVQLDGLGGQLLGGSAADAAALNTLACIVDANPEMIAYQGSTLTGANAYNLTGIVRGAYGSPVNSHASGARFVRIDGAIVKGDPIDPSMIGQTMYFKFCSFNVWGSGGQDLSTVPEYQYTITGSALKGSLDNITGLMSFFRSGLTVLSWRAVTDPVRVIDYEIRKGASWATAQVIGRTPNTEFPADGDGEYWVSAHSDYAYSSTPATLIIAGSTLVKNVVATFDELATGWGGSLSGGAYVSGSSLALGGSGLVSAISVISAQPTIAYYGGVASSGVYTIPVSHEVDIGTVQNCNCSVNYIARTDNPFNLFSLIPDVAALDTIAGNYNGQASVLIQIAVSDISGTYGAWADFMPGAYTGRKFKFQALLSSSDTSIIAALDAFTFTVDMPDRVEQGTNFAVPSGGASVVYATPFQIAPNVQITILNASPGDDIVLTAATKTGFTIQIVNGGSGVARSINHTSQAY